MTRPADLLRSHLTSAENALVPDVDVESALLRACAGGSARTRVEVAALMVYAGPYTTRIPTLESRPLRRPLWARLLTGELAPVVRPAVAVLSPRRAAVALPQAA